MRVSIQRYSSWSGKHGASTEGTEMNNLKFPKWQQPYLEALMETDQDKLARRVDLAEMKILSRLREIQDNSNKRIERQAIEDALSGLTVLKMETVEFQRSQEQPLYSTQFRIN
jgi:hypothetical protein